MVAAAPKQAGEGGLQGQSPGPRQPRADHPQTLGSPDLLLVLNLIKCRLEIPWSQAQGLK